MSPLTIGNPLAADGSPKPDVAQLRQALADAIAAEQASKEKLNRLEQRPAAEGAKRALLLACCWVGVGFGVGFGVGVGIGLLLGWCWLC